MKRTITPGMTLRLKRIAAAIGAAGTILMALAHPAQAQAQAQTQSLRAAPVRAAEQTISLPQAEMEKLVAAYALVKQNYVGKADDTALFEGAISGMLASLDAHSQYMTSDDMRDLDREDSGKYVGIGIEVEVDRDWMRVVSTNEDSPAARAGIVAGDIIASIDGVDVGGMSGSEVARRMHGEPGSIVTVGIARGAEPGRSRKLLTLRLTRAPLRNDTVQTRMAAPGLPWIRISQFGGNTGADLAAALKKLDGKDAPRGLILDLRNDPGGLVPAAVSVAGAFLAPGTVLFTARGQRQGSNASVTVDPRYYRESGQPDVLAGLPAWTRTVPLTVLVNGASASAAELVAGALQDQRRATVVGSQTFGKGSIQTVIPLGDDSGIKFTVARYFTPNGREIQARGITPDIVVTPKAGEDDELLLREADLAKHLPASSDAPAVKAPHAPLESTRTFGTREDQALHAALALLAPQDSHAPTLAGLLRKWSEELKPGTGGAP